MGAGLTIGLAILGVISGTIGPFLLGALGLGLSIFFLGASVIAVAADVDELRARTRPAPPPTEPGHP